MEHRIYILQCISTSSNLEMNSVWYNSCSGVQGFTKRQSFICTNQGLLRSFQPKATTIALLSGDESTLGNHLYCVFPAYTPLLRIGKTCPKSSSQETDFRDVSTLRVDPLRSFYPSSANTLLYTWFYRVHTDTDSTAPPKAQGQKSLSSQNLKCFFVLVNRN